MSDTLKKGLIVGLANDQSIAWGCVKAFHNELKAEMAITYQNQKTRSHIQPLTQQVNTTLFMPLDVTKSDEIDAVFDAITTQWGELDFILHSIAFAPKQDLQGRFIDCSAEGFQLAMDVSCHSLIKLCKKAEPLMKKGGSVISMSYYGAEKVIGHYGMMGAVKSALETSVKYLAYELGHQNIRVNAISSGPVKTRAASGLSHFDALMEEAGNKAPLHQVVSIEQIGQLAAFLASDKALNITGQILYVDNGYSIIG